MPWANDQRIAAVECQADAPALAIAFHGHLGRAKSGRFNIDRQLLDRSDQDVTSVRLATQHGREKADHRRPGDRRSTIEPGAVAGDPHAAIAATGRVPSIDRRRPAALLDRSGKRGEGLALGFDGRTAFGHRSGHVGERARGW